MINIFHWNRAGKCMQPVTADTLLQRREELLGNDGVLWIDLADPTEDEERLVLQEFFPIHKLSLEDMTRLRREPDAAPHLPKVEEFADYLFAVVNPLTAHYQDFVSGTATTTVNLKKPFTQLSVVLTHTILITHHYASLKCVTYLTDFLSRHEAQIDRGPDYLFHLVLDSTVDEFAPVLDYIEETLDDLEVAVVAHPQQKLFLRMLRLKREIIVLRKTLIAEREVLVRLARGEFDLVDERETVYYRNVYDHLVRFTELMESSREMAADLMQTFLSAQSNHLNQIMKVLTMISTIVLPMTLVAGVYGMNFDMLVPASQNYFGFYIALAMMLASGAISLAYFRWNRWL